MIPGDYTVSGFLNNIKTSVQNIDKNKFETNDNQINITITHNDPRYTLSGLVINKTKNIPEGGVDVSVTNETKKSVITRQSNAEDGIFNAQLEAGSDFTLVGKKADYISNIERISTKGLNRSATLYVKLELGIEEAKVGQSIVLNNIYFEVGKANIDTAFSTDLDKLIQFLKDNPETRLEIQGHTDNTGSLNLNNNLSQSRANSVVDYLTKNGIDRNQLIAKGYGPSLPVADNATADGRTKNRRVVMKVLQ
jgi:outer membrane protein OmpA-like peptidoglycan-associated protein